MPAALGRRPCADSGTRRSGFLTGCAVVLSAVFQPRLLPPPGPSPTKSLQALDPKEGLVALERRR